MLLNFISQTKPLNSFYYPALDFSQQVTHRRKKRARSSEIYIKVGIRVLRGRAHVFTISAWCLLVCSRLSIGSRLFMTRHNDMAHFWDSVS